MHHEKNYSTAQEIAFLSRQCMFQFPFFRKVVNTIEYKCQSAVDPDYTYKWENINKLLKDEPAHYGGIKTGWTPTAGACLSASYRSTDGVYDLIIVVMNCREKQYRFTEVPKLV